MANTVIKITQLPNIGNNLGANTLLPVVDTTGTAVTDKVTVGNVANFILSEAGNLLPTAFTSELALDVVNGAQPNITSLGNLTGLTITNLANLNIPGGENGYVLQTNGNGNLDWTAMAGSGNGSPGGANSQLQFNLNGDFAGDNELTWDAGNNKLNTVNFAASHATIYGNVDVVNVNATGNLVPNAIYTDHYYYANGYIFGGGGGNGAPSGSNTQVQFNDNGAFGGNSGFTFDKTSGTLASPFLTGNGNGLSNIQGANVSGFVSNANVANTAFAVAGANVSGEVSFAGTANSVAVGNVVGIGNIATLALNGSSSDVLYGNGQWASAGGGLPLANGTSNIDIATANGNATITSNGTYTWTFDDNGGFNLTAYGVIRGNTVNMVSNSFAQMQWVDSGNLNIADPNDSAGPKNWAFVDTEGFWIETNLNETLGNIPHTWQFNNDGTTEFPNLTVDLHNGGVQNGEVLQFGREDLQSIITGPTPSVDTNAQRLIIQGQRGNGTGEGGDVYFWAGDADTNGGDIKIYAGDADNVSTGYGGYINLDGGSGFDNGGQVNITGGYSANGQGGAVSVSAGQGGTDGGAININGGSATANQGGNIALQAGYGGNNGGEVRLTGGSAGVGLPGYGNVVLVSGASTWTFDNAGVLNLPGGTGTIESTANNISIYSDAGQLNGALFYDTGAEIYALQDFAIFTDNANASHIWRFYANGNMTAPGAINVGNMVIGTVPGDITADANTGVTFNVSGPDGGFAVNYLDEVGNANTSGGELAFSSETGNATYRISLSDDLGDGFATKIWRFDGTGNLVLAGGSSVIQSIANSSLDPLNPNVSTMTLTPDANYNSQILVLDPTAPGHIHLRAFASSNIDEPSANIFLGGENTSFEVTSGSNNVAKIHSGGNTWTFTNAGDLQLASGNSVISSLPNNAGDGSGLSTINLYPDSSTGDDRYLIIDPTGPSHLHLRAGGVQDASNVLLYLGGEQTYVQIDDGYHRVSINSYDVGNGIGYNWRFDFTGNLVLPGNTVAINFANGSAAFGNIVGTNIDGNSSNVLFGNGTFAAVPGGSYGDSNVATLLGSFGSNSISTTGNVTANNFSGNTNGFTLGYLDIPQVSASNTTIGLTDAGKHYYSTTAGNITLTVPNNATTSFATGTAISIVVQAAGNILVNAASGVTLYMAGSSSAGNRVVGAYGMATLMKVASDTWFINGTGVY